MNCNKFIDDTAMCVLLEKAKLALRMKTTAFDEEIKDIIQAGYLDLSTKGVIIDGGNLSPLITRAIITYVRLHFGEPENPERLKESYDEQKGQLMITSGYTVWG